MKVISVSKRLNLEILKEGVSQLKVINTTVTVSSVPPCEANANGTVDIFDLHSSGQVFGQKSALDQIPMVTVR